MPNKNTTTAGARTQEWMQEMADIAQEQGMHPDKINSVCGTFTDLLAALRWIHDNTQHTGSREAAAAAISKAEPFAKVEGK